jgi:CubicO group peptidase (beta-lactamase class C family)
MNSGVYEGIRILKEENINEMHTIQCQKTYHDFSYGLGWQINGKLPSNRFISNTGGFWGVRAKMKFSPYDKIGIIFFANVNPFDSKKMGKLLRRFIADNLIEELLFRKAFLKY